MSVCMVAASSLHHGFFELRFWLWDLEKGARRHERNNIPCLRGFGSDPGPLEREESEKVL